MIRTQVYIPDDLYKDMLLVSKSYNIKTSDLFREGLKTVVKKKLSAKKNQPYPFANMIGKGGKGGPKDLATNLDYYLYEQPYENSTRL